MIYCPNSTKATVSYEFSNKKKEIYVTSNPPIDVIVTEPSAQLNSVSQNYKFTFDGNQLTTYSYNCFAPVGVPSYAACFITAGTWDDYGTIGSYRSPTVFGQINSFSGEPVFIGQGLQFSGTVTNTIKFDCRVDITLNWQWGRWKIEILKDGILLHSDQGDKQINFTVTCDDDCPPNHCKCHSTKYPGYCCIPCKEVAARINNIAARI